MTGRRWVDQLAGIVGRAVGSAVTGALERRTSTRGRAAQGEHPDRGTRQGEHPGDTGLPTPQPERAGKAEHPGDTGLPTPQPGRAGKAEHPGETGVSTNQAGATARGEHPAYPGDLAGVPTISYDPHPGTLPDPGEVVWTWVPYEEDHRRGKDRPVLVIGRDGRWLLALPLTSMDHDRDAEQEAREGRFWYDIGAGPWDRQGRASEVRLDRIVRVDPDGVRREGAALSRAVFDLVAEHVLAHR